MPSRARGVILPMEWTEWLAGSQFQPGTTRSATMGKGNNSQKNDKKSMKPKQDKTKPAPKK
jgi:hypothetical protein